MKIKKMHNWKMSAAEARALQAELAGKIEEKTPANFSPRTVAAADISANRFSNRLFAAVVVMTFPELELIEAKTAMTEAVFPYVPGLLSFRELPALEAVFRAVEAEPDFVLMDGQGRAHPRRLGLACHAGLMLDRPVIGVAKSVLVGEYREPGQARGAAAPLMHKEETIGEALRTRHGVKPVFVSVGHKIDLATAKKLVLECAPKYRIPMPARAAHDAANRARREYYSRQK